MTRAELIEALEKAEGPSRELDAHVWAITLPRVGEGFDGYGLPDGAHYEYEADDRGGVSLYVVMPDGVSRRRAKRPSPEITASLDAATALVERVLPGHGYVIEHHPCYGPHHAASVFSDTAVTIGNGRGPNGAIALCLALFRALEAKEAAE